MRMAIVVLSVSLLAAPSLANERGANEQGAKQSEASKAAAAPAAKGTKYCIQYGEITGSRIQSVVCKTKARWARLGVDVDKLDKD